MIRFKSLFSIAAAILAVFSFGSPAAAQGGSFVATGSLVDGGRSVHAAVRLADGRVIVVGGTSPEHSSTRASAEIYDPATGTWSLTGGMATARQWITASLLPDGSVLIAGGSGGGPSYASTEIWDPATGAFTSGASMNSIRFAHSAVTLADGRILVTGGDVGTDGPIAQSSAEIYDPATGAWTWTGSMSVPRQAHEAVRLADGRVLVTGGDQAALNGYTPTPSCEIYDPATGVFSATGPMTVRRELHGLVLLHDGRVLAAGGTRYGGDYDHDAEIFDPATNSWSSAGPISCGGALMTLTVLPDGRALAAGGLDGTGPPYVISRHADIFDPATGSFSAAPDMTVPRAFGTATLLEDGSVLLVGGTTDASAPLDTATAERFVAVVSNNAPIAGTGADQTVECTGPGGTTVTLDGSASSDPDGDVLTYEWTGPFGAATGVSPSVSLSMGVSMITLTVTDAHGASATDTLVVTVQDTTAPAWTSLSATPNVLGPANHRMVAVVLTGAATDACDGSSSLAIASVTSNEAVDGPGDWVVTGAMTLDLRAERVGKGSGRIYTITVRATDASGNSSLKAVSVTVPKGK